MGLSLGHGLCGANSVAGALAAAPGRGFWVLIAAATLLAFASALTVWVHRQALDTNAVTKASTQMLQNDQVRGALSTYLVDQLYNNVNVSQTLSAKPPTQPSRCGPARRRAATALGTGREPAAPAPSSPAVVRERGAHRARRLHPDHQRQREESRLQRRHRLSQPETLAHRTRGPDRNRNETGGEAPAERRQDRDHEAEPAGRDPDRRESDQGADDLPRHRRARPLRAGRLPRARLPAADPAQRRGRVRHRRRRPTGRPPRRRQHAGRTRSPAATSSNQHETSG